MNVQKVDASYLSADGKTMLSAIYCFDKEVAKIGVLQIVHGMCEHMERYEDFISHMVGSGFVVCIHDQLGHGSTSKPDDYGFFASENGAEIVLQDIVTLNRKMYDVFKKLPLFLLGHSMGSFFARWFAERYPSYIDGVIFMGTSGPNPMGAFGITLTKALTSTFGEKHRSKLVHNLSIGGYAKKMKNPKTPYDWISTKRETVDKYAADYRCTFKFTVSGFKDILTTMQHVNEKEWALAVPKKMPILLISGEDDPVGDFGEGVKEVYNALKEAEHENLRLILYKGMRHEPLNEVENQMVYNDLSGWLLYTADPSISCTCMSTTIRRSKKCAHCSF